MADRLPRGLLMAGSELFAGLCQLLIAVLFASGHLQWFVLGALFAAKGSANALFLPASVGVLPTIVAPEQLPRSNATLRLGMNIVRISGAGLVALLATTVGSVAVLWVDAATYLIASAMLATVRWKGPAPRSRSQTLGRDLRAGWCEFSARRWLLVSVLQVSYVNAASSAFVVVLGPLALRQAGHGVSVWSALVALQTIGLVAGSVVAMRLRFSRPVAVAVMLPCSKGLPMALLALDAPLWSAGVTMLFAVVCSDVYGVTWDSTLQRTIPEQSLSRVSSYDMLASFSGAPLGITLVGLLLGLALPTTILMVVAVGVIASGPVAVESRSVRGLRAPAPEPLAS